MRVAIAAGQDGGVTQLAKSILNMPPAVALLFVFALPALEASAFIGIVFPGEIAALLGGVLAHQGRIPLWAAISAAIAGAVVGDSVGYVVGRRFGESLLLRLPSWLLKPDHIEKSKSAVNRLGGKAVFVGRFTAALRVLVPGMCGMARMPYRKFAAWNIAGGVVWAGGCVVLGYLAGSSWEHLHRRMSDAGLIALGVVILGGALFFVVRRRRRSRASEQS
jgi:undecaprenyl-diphosphatase